MRAVNYYLEPFSRRMIERDDTDAVPGWNPGGRYCVKAYVAQATPVERAARVIFGDAETCGPVPPGVRGDARAREALDFWATFVGEVLDDYRTHRHAELSGHLTPAGAALLDYFGSDAFAEALDAIGLEPSAARRAWREKVDAEYAALDEGRAAA